MTTTNLKQASEERHAIALADFRDYLEEIRDECQIVIRAANDASACVGPLMTATPREGHTEATLIESAKALDAFDWRTVSDDLRTEARRIEVACREICGAIEQAQLLRRYLEAGDFSEPED